ncbi:MAG: type IV secretory system conjugative DNA transfer family protein [Oscillospiraceae bacterium]
MKKNKAFVNDPSGEILNSVGPILESQGYKIKVFNPLQVEKSCNYNPFNYIQREEDIEYMVDMLMLSTTPTGTSKGDPFWEKSETALLKAICYYLWAFRPKDEQNFSSVMTLLEMVEIKEDDSDFESPLDLIFKDIRDVQPEYWCVKQYDIFKQATGKTAKSILIDCKVRLSRFNFPAVKQLTNSDNMELDNGKDENVVVFCVNSVIDIYSFLSITMCRQLL